MRLLVAVLDALQMIVISVATAWVFFPNRLAESAGIGLMGASLALAIRRSLRSTTSFHRVTIQGVARRAGFAVLAACSIMLAIIVLIGGSAHASQFGPWVISWGLLSAIVSYTVRALPVPVLRSILLRAIQPTVAVVGDPMSAQVMGDMLSRQGNHLVVAQFDPENPHDMCQLEQRAGRGKIDKVVIVGGNETLLESVCFALADTPTLVCVGFSTATTSSLMIEGLNTTQHPLFIPLVPSPMSDWRGLLKRLFDIVLVVGALPLLTPLLILVAVAIRAESSGPVLFRQWRFGLGSKPTQIIKFRTMYHDRGDSTGEQRTVAYDPRVTMVGRILRRTSIDELPQLLNVLRGEMSLVGPRPHATHMKVDGNYYFEAVRGYRFRHRVKPGITGWAQITGSRGEVDTIDKALERVEKDLWYVRNWSLALDLRILMLTVLGKFASPGAD
jgi:exopolysaccharide biosynthesis polyprenyl glycosylphosphotransferase